MCLSCTLGSARGALNTDNDSISAKGFGDTHPVDSNDTPEGRAKNRRILITVQGPGAPSTE